MTVSYDRNKNINFFEDNQYDNDNSPEVYEEILNEYEWSVSLIDYNNSISMRLDNYYNTNYNNKLIKYLYDKEEETWFPDTYVDDWVGEEEEEEEEYEEIIA
jgi:hypothetical protein